MEGQASERRDSDFARVHGPLSGVWSDLRRDYPEFFSAYVDLAAVPWRRGGLDDRTRELILVAINAAVTHLNREQIAFHMGRALDAGATKDEVAEVLQLVSVLGIHATSVGFPALCDVARQAGVGDQLPSGELTEREMALKADFQRSRGYWNEFWENALQLDPDLFEAYFRFSSVPWEHGVLDPKVREFVYVAIDASTTHMFDQGTRGHMANAFGYGATVPELLEVLELCVGMGIQSMTVGLPLLLEEVRRREGGT